MSSFIDRAKNAYHRGDEVRGLTTLINGLKRTPESDEAVQLLLQWYGVDAPKPGLESDVIGAIRLQPDANDLMSVLVDNLRSGGHDEVAQALLDEGELRGLAYVPPEADALLEPEPPRLKAEDPEDTLDGLPLAGRLEKLVEESESGTPEPEPEPEPEPDPEPEPEPHAEEALEEPVEISAADEAQRVESAESEPQTKQRETRKQSDEVESKPPRHLAYALIAIAFVGLAAWGWTQAKYQSDLAALDSRLETMDPMNLDTVRSSLKAEAARWDDDPAFSERMRFLDALGTKEGWSNQPASTEWGTAANCIGFIRSQDAEKAIQSQTKVERLFPDSLASNWCAALVAEGRGRPKRAAEIWKSTVKERPAFVAGLLGAIRSGVRSADAETVSFAAEKLQKLDEDHPYLVATNVELGTTEPYFELGTPSEVELIPVVETEDAFLAATTYLIRAQALVKQHKWIDAKNEVETAVALDPMLAPGLLLVSVLRALNYEVDSLRKAAQLLAGLEGLNREFKADSRAIIGRAAAFAGRPDVAADLLGIAGKMGQGWLKQTFEGSKDNAITEGTVLNELGRVKEAIDTLSKYALRTQDDQVAYVAHLMALQNGWKLDVDLTLSTEAAEARKAAVAHFEGNHRLASEIGGKIPAESPYRAITMRFVVQSLLALRQVGEALSQIEARPVPLLDRIFLDGARVRAFARLRSGNEDYKQLFARMASVDPIGVNRTTDLAYAAFWQGDRRRTNELLDEAIARNEDHRKANWLKGVLLRSQGKFKQAAPYLAKSGRDMDSNPHVLFELGNVNFELKNYDEARKMYYRSLLRDRDDLASLYGLGRAYAQIGGSVAVRDLQRILDTYPATMEYAAHRAEVMKWLAVLSGVRNGNTEALQWLDKAEELVGKRADVLVERARHFESIDQPKEARRLFAAALQTNSTQPQAHLGLARTALKLGDKKIARDHLEKFLQFSFRGPDRDWAEEQLAKL